MFGGLHSGWIVRWVLALSMIAVSQSYAKDKCTVSFDDASLEMGDMTSVLTFGFTYSKCKNQVVSTEGDYTLETYGGFSIGYEVVINGGTLITDNKKNQTKTLTITPDAYPVIQRAGDYSDNLTLVISAP